MIIPYDRQAALEYAKVWCGKQSVLYPDLTLLYGNNSNFIYQCLLNGGFYSKPSAYWDVTLPRLSPTISKIVNLEKSLLIDLKAIKYTQGSPDHSDLKTGDIIVLEKNNIRNVVLCEIDTNLYAYSQSPVRRKQIIQAMDQYHIYLLPDNIEV